MSGEGDISGAPGAGVLPGRDGRASAEASRAADVLALRLVTYNIHRAVGVDRRFSPERIAEVLRHHDADVVLLQEVDRGVARAGHTDLASLLARLLEYRYRAVGMNVHRRTGRYGNATLARFPIGRQRNIDLSVRWMVRRGAQHTRIHLPVVGQDVQLDVFNVHLGLSAMERRKQALLLLESPDVRRLAPTDACVIAGDTNDWRGVLHRRHFAPAGWRCATSDQRQRRAVRTFPSFAPTGALDRVYYRGPLRVVSAHRSRLGLARVASDHLPVIVNFELALCRLRQAREDAAGAPCGAGCADGFVAGARGPH